MLFANKKIKEDVSVLLYGVRMERETSLKYQGQSGDILHVLRRNVSIESHEDNSWW